MLARIPRAAFTLTAAALLAASPWACGSSESTTPEFEELGGSGGVGDGSGASGPSTSSSKAASSSSSSKAASSSHASVSSSGPGGAGGAGGSGGSPPCNDTGVEPNDDEASAAQLGTITDCDDTGSMTQGVLAGAADTDWFKYVATDELGCVVDPTRGITVVGSARLCKFIQCVSGTASNTCPAGTTAEMSPGGLPGCCGDDDFQMDTDCNGIDDDATVFIRLDQATDSCAKYTLTFHY